MGGTITSGLTGGLAGSQNIINHANPTTILSGGLIQAKKKKSNDDAGNPAPVANPASILGSALDTSNNNSVA